MNLNITRSNLSKSVSQSCSTSRTENYRHCFTQSWKSKLLLRPGLGVDVYRRYRAGPARLLIRHGITLKPGGAIARPPTCQTKGTHRSVSGRRCTNLPRGKSRWRTRCGVLCQGARPGALPIFVRKKREGEPGGSPLRHFGFFCYAASLRGR